METPAWDMEECANSPQCEAGEACCYGLGHFSSLFQECYTYTNADKTTNSQGEAAYLGQRTFLICSCSQWNTSLHSLNYIAVLLSSHTIVYIWK